MQNVSEDTDEMFDDLFNKYGKVVFRSTDVKSPTAEVDDDAESLACKPKPYIHLQYIFLDLFGFSNGIDVVIHICCSCC